MLTLVTGGASSGKSTFACRAAGRHGDRVLYVATCEPRDTGMRDKIARHRAERPAHWTTLERSEAVATALTGEYDACVVDCLTLLVSQQLVASREPEVILAEIDALAAVRPGYPVYVVTNEVGQGVVPPNALARRFTELQGHTNQRMADRADTVVWMVAGIPVIVKGAPITVKGMPSTAKGVPSTVKDMPCAP
jgi:adenosylcobinamide kinase / adenosylcobinamide-phosphate guanylyltransferase